MDIVLADGSNQTKLTCLGQVTLESETQIGLIIIEPQNAQVLVGMDFLKKFKKQLIVDPTSGRVEIVAANSLSP